MRVGAGSSFAGDTGVGFSIVDRADISCVVSNIRNAAMVRDVLCYGYDGTMFHPWFYDGGGAVTGGFAIHWEDAARGDTFFYCDPESSLCVDHLKALEEASKE